MKQVVRMVVLALAFAACAPLAQAQSPILKEIESAFVRLHEDVGPSVVNIDTRGALEDGGDNMEFFHFFGIPTPEGERPQFPQQQPMRPRATGSGFVYTKDGYIITNNHVVENAETITVKLYNGREYKVKAEDVKRDPETDVAVLKIETEEELIPARLGDSDGLLVGQFAIAIGSPRGFEGSVSFGHISALGRQDLGGLYDQGLKFQDLIQTDAAINLGNSGGPLCNINGEVIGINTAILWGANSIGFAIPINTVTAVVPMLIKEGKVVRGFLGVGISHAREVAEALELPDEDGAFVERVEDDSPAAKADIRTYDVIRSVNGQAVRDANDLVKRISAFPPGEVVKLEIWRDKELVMKEATLSERPAPSEEPRSESRQVLGMSLADLTPEMVERLGLEEGTKGVLITGVKPGTAAEEAGLMQGDIITEVAKQPVASADELRAILGEQAKTGKQVLVRYIRNGREVIGVLKPAPEE
ncbi:MAG: trypsin-like peptidase domain-containing protein [Candidatus Hydrogenedentes bacterium]|nr:trypsin-like peptidase domain-containing protein [Candidatus Hydrogenedentota bacterium]